MKKLQKRIMWAIVGFLAATSANAVPFTITAVSFTPGTGYGTDASEASGTLLDVQFSTSGFLAQDTTLNAVNDSFGFVFGTVNLQEPNSNGGINANEQDNLGVTASFTFTNPLGNIENVLATGTAITGSVSDAAVDYTLVWDPVQVGFGNGGLFQISMNSLSFAGTGSQTQSATVTLLRLPETTQQVPEPATLALLGVGLLGAAVSRRKAARKA